MDAIKKKINSLKTETETLNKRITDLEQNTKDSEAVSAQCDVDVR